METGTETLIKVDNITKRYKKKVVLKNLNLDLYYGEILGIIGGSGAGKTTLLKTIIGYLKPEQGNVYIRLKPLLRQNAEDYNHFQLMTPEFNRLFGFAMQEGSFYPEMTIKENMFYFANLHNITGETMKKNTYLLLKLVDLYEQKDVLAKELSEGMQKRLDIACAMIHNPKILILDEPTADIDPSLRKQLLYLIKKINEKGITTIISSHMYEEISTICHRIGLIHQGQLTALGSPKQLKTRYTDTEEIYLETYPGDYERIIQNLASKNIYVDSVEQKGKAVILQVKHAELIMPRLMYAIEQIGETILKIQINKPSLNDILKHVE